MRRWMLSAIAALFVFALPSLAMASAGTAQGVDPAAAAVSGAQTRTLIVGADINIGDVIKTGDKGQVEILFADNTKLVVGPNSNLEIQDYLIRANGSAGKFAVDMLAGTFRFVTGTAPKSDYVINTPTGTIGVRGTGFDVFVDANGVAHIMMYEGETQLCDKHAKACQQLADLCQVGQIDSSAATVVGNLNTLTGAQRSALRTLFAYSLNESSLDRQFRLPGAYDCTHKPPDTSAPSSLGTGGDGGVPVRQSGYEWHPCCHPCCRPPCHEVSG